LEFGNSSVRSNAGRLRAWATSEDFPKRGRISYLDGEIARRDGWQYWKVFERWFRLQRKKGMLDIWKYHLDSKKK